MKEFGIMAAVIAAYNELSKPGASQMEERRRTDSVIDFLIDHTQRDELQWFFGPPRSDFYTLGHVALAQTPDGYRLILEQVSDTLGKHYSEDGERVFTHSLTILDSEGQEAFFATDQGLGWSMTGARLNELSEKEKAVHRSYRLSELYNAVVGDQRRNKPRERIVV